MVFASTVVIVAAQMMLAIQQEASGMIGQLSWPSFCAGRSFERRSDCTYDTLPRLGVLNIEPSVAPSRNASKRDADAEILRQMRTGYWGLKPYGCFVRENGAVYFNERKISTAHAFNETIVCSKCDTPNANLSQDSFFLQRGGVCSEIPGYCPITTPALCAHAASSSGLHGNANVYSGANVTSLLVVMAGSRVGSTWFEIFIWL